jgi:hypothetical protein
MPLSYDSVSDHNHAKRNALTHQPIGKIMPLLRKFSAVATALFFSCTFAAAYAGSNNGNNEVLSVVIHDSGHAVVEFATSSHTEACAAPSLKNYIAIPQTHPHFKILYATALTALATGRRLSGWVDGCTSLYGNMVPTVLTMGILK